MGQMRAWMRHLESFTTSRYFHSAEIERRIINPFINIQPKTLNYRSQDHPGMNRHIE
jgi:hypothetical protein